jgi:hypothetical protein
MDGFQSLAGCGMVHNLMQVTRDNLETGGGAKAATKIIRASFGASFTSFISNNEKFFCDSSLEPYAWCSCLSTYMPSHGNRGNACYGFVAPHNACSYCIAHQACSGHN